MVKSQTILTDFDTYYDNAYQTWNPFFGEAERDLRFFLGDQWSQQEKNDLFQQGRACFVFNRIRRTINLITGYQRKNRLSSVVIPQEDSDQQTADQLSKLLLYVMQAGDGYQCISDCFGGALKTGFNLCSLWMDYRDDPLNGDIRFEREPYNAFIVDPYFTKRDFSDCAYILKRKYLSLEQAVSMLPTHAKELKNLQKIGWDRDDKFTWIPYQRTPNGQDLLAYNEMWVQKWRNIPMLVDMETGEMMEFDRQDELVKQFIQIYPQLKVVQRPKKYVELQIIVNNEYMDTEINPYGLDEYPMTPSLAIFEPESDEWSLRVQSLSRCLIDPQRESNQRRSQMSDIVNTQINSGWLAEEDSVINPQSLFQTSQGKVIWKKAGSSPGAVERLQPAQIAASSFQLQELYDRDLTEIAGVNDAAFGQTEMANDSGVMMLLRQGASVVNLQELFDNLRFLQKQVSKKALKFIQRWKPEKVKRILNEEPTKEFYNLDVVKYDVCVQEGVLTDTQRQLYFRQLVDLKQLGAPVTGEQLAKAAPIQGGSQYIKELQQAEQQQAQQAQQQQAVQMQLLKTQSESAQAKAISDVALSKERFTRAVANMGLQEERNAQAVHDRSQATLEKIKAMKELQNMDDDRIIKYLQIVQQLDSINRADEIQNKSEDIAVTEQSEKMNAAFPQPQSVPQVQQPPGGET